MSELVETLGFFNPGLNMWERPDGAFPDVYRRAGGEFVPRYVGEAGEAGGKHRTVLDGPAFDTLDAALGWLLMEGHIKPVT